MPALKTEIGRPWLARYPADVPARIDYPNVSIGEVLQQTSRRHGDAEAIIFQGSTLTWAQINSYSNRLAGALSDRGVGKGDRVVLLLPNLPHFVMAYYATLKLGAIVVAASPLFADVEIERYIRKVDPKVLITLDSFYDRVRGLMASCGGNAIVICNPVDFLPAHVRFLTRTIHKLDGGLDLLEQGPSAIRAASSKVRSALGRVPAVRRIRDIPKSQVRGAERKRVTSLVRELKRYPDLAPAIQVDPSDVAALLYTTGTTGTPKAAVLTHRNLLVNAWQMRCWFPELKEGRETILAVLPFFHAYGLTLVMNAGLVLAARSVLIPRPVLSDIFDAIQRFRPTALPGVPALFISITSSERVKRYDLRSIRVCVSGGAPLPLEVKQRFDSLTGGHLYEGYGLTEASPLTHAQPSDQSAPAGSIGIPVSDTEAMIVDDRGRPVEDGQAGELLVRGPQVMAGYWDDPEDTAEVLKDGWLHTGDIATMDESGYFYIVDRKKDLIITGGENIAPREIEEALYQHPKVLEAAVGGIPHRFGGEIAKAWIVLRPGEASTRAEMARWLETRLAHYKVPRAIEFREALPKSPMGKVLRRPLIEEEKAKRRKTSKASIEVTSGADGNGSPPDI